MFEGVDLMGERNGYMCEGREMGEDGGVEGVYWCGRFEEVVREVWERWGEYRGNVGEGKRWGECLCVGEEGEGGMG